ncbi:hypothetical protein [Micromonospora craniellae]|nr:hypothetical protein [Micromonospora craniellae]
MAVGTGLNLPHYPADVQLSGVDWSPRTVRPPPTRCCAPRSTSSTW